MELVKISVAIASAGFLVLAAAVEAKAVSLTYDSQIGIPANLSEGDVPGAPGTLAALQGIAVQGALGQYDTLALQQLVRLHHRQLLLDQPHLQLVVMGGRHCPGVPRSKARALRR